MTETTDLSFRAKILDVREQRRLAAPLEYRTDTATGQLILEGYAATFSPYDVYGGVAAGGWVEQIDSRAFDATLATNPDCQLLLNHEGLPLARTKSGTLALRADGHGLLVRATLDPSDPDVQRLMPKMRRGDMDEMSFAFRVRDQQWDCSYTQRMITDINLDKGDVSVVNYGMNPTTAAMLSSTEAISALAKLSNTDLLEIRKLDRDQVRRALSVLSSAAADPPKKHTTGEMFADPGYKDSAGDPAKGGNGVKRYRLNSATRVRGAWRYICMPKNRDGYTCEQLAAIEGRIRGAAKKFGVDLAAESHPASIAARTNQPGWTPPDTPRDPDDDAAADVPDDDDNQHQHPDDYHDEDPNTVTGKLAELRRETRLTPPGTVSAGLRYIAAQRDLRAADDEPPAGLLTVAAAAEYLRAASS
jgi:HK97 family phage prohead protease